MWFRCLLALASCGWAFPGFAQPAPVKVIHFEETLFAVPPEPEPVPRVHESPEDLMMRAHIQLELGEHQKAIATLNRILEDTNDAAGHVHLHIQIAEVYRTLDDTASFLAQTQSAFDVLKQHPQGLEHARLVFQEFVHEEARWALLQGQYSGDNTSPHFDTAITLYTVYLESEPAGRDALSAFDLAELQHHRQRYPEAIQAYAKALAWASEDDAWLSDAKAGLKSACERVEDSEQGCQTE